MRLSTAALLAARFPYVTPSGRVPAECGYEGDLRALDKPPDVVCAHPGPNVRCEGRYVDGGYTDNSGLFTLVAVWPSLRALILQHNIDAENRGVRPIAPMIVELDNHYQRSTQPCGVRKSGPQAARLYSWMSPPSRSVRRSF